MVLSRGVYPYLKLKQEVITMDKYIDKINESGLPTMMKQGLKTFCYFVEYYQELKAQGIEPDEKWLEAKLKEHGVDV